MTFMAGVKYKDHLGNRYDTLEEMCNHYNIRVQTYINRRNRGWSLEGALTRPVRTRRKVG